MSFTPVIEDAVAIVPVKDIRRTVNFYVDILGFEARFVSQDETFAIVLHGDAAIHFVRTDSDEVLKATANNISIYLWIRQVDIFYEHLKAKLDSLPKGQVRPPFTQDYGMREFHVKDPDGCLLFFGEEIRTVSDTE